MSQHLYEDEYRGEQPFRTLLYLYREDSSNIASMLFYAIKHSPVWIAPLGVANVIDVISHYSTHSPKELWLNGAFLAASVVQNISTYLHIRVINPGV